MAIILSVTFRLDAQLGENVKFTSINLLLAVDIENQRFREVKQLIQAPELRCGLPSDCKSL